MGINNSSHFDQIRQQNRRMIRNLMRHLPQFGKAELADISGLSFPTVSALLSELCLTGEVIILPDSTSRGGRPAEQFTLNPLFQAAACVYVENHELFVRVCDVLGNILFDDRKKLDPGYCDVQLKTNLLDIKTKYPALSVVCLGIPGVIVNGQVTYLPDYKELQGLDLQDFLEKELLVPVSIENDVNVLVFAEREKWPDLVHIFYGTNCPGSGILLDGQIIHGFTGCAGELEYLPFEHNGHSVTFAEELSRIAAYSMNPELARQNDSLTDHTPDPKSELIACLARAAASFVCVINPPDIALSGFDLTEADTEDLGLALADLLPFARCPVFHIVNEVDDLYQSGLLQIAMDYWKSK